MKNIIKIHDEKFKSIYISNNFYLDMNNKDNGINSILALILSKSCEKYKTEQEIEKYLANLYGTNFNVDVQKIGDLFNIEFSIEIINDKEIIKKYDIINKAIKFLNEIIYNHGKFEQEMFNREKNYILNKIGIKKDEKLKYAVLKTEEILCENEPFGNYIYGESELVENIKLEDIENGYNKLINSNNVVIITGNLDGIVLDEKSIKTSKIKNDIIYNQKYLNLDNNIKEIKEKIKTNQSVLTVGMKVEDLNLEDFYPLIIYNTILGGTASSKLFQNIREKESLAYTIKSRYYRFKGIFIIYAGIQYSNYEKSKKLIINEINKMKNKISSQELESSKQEIISNILEWRDSKISLSKNAFTEYIEKRNITLDEVINNIKKITIQDIYNVSEKVKIKSFYLLGGGEDE